jgi:hypothetical protein
MDATILVTRTESCYQNDSKVSAITISQIFRNGVCEMYVPLNRRP